MKPTILWVSIAIAAAVAGVSVRATARTCEFPQRMDGLHVELTTPADGPVVVRIPTWDSEELAYRPLVVGDVTELTVVGEAGTVPGSFVVRNADREDPAEVMLGDRLLWTPDAALAHQRYELRLAIEGSGVMTADVVVVATPGPLTAPPLSDLVVSETAVGTGTRRCCETDCRYDLVDCVAAEYVERCDICWFEEWEYPMTMWVEVEPPPDLPTNWLDRRVYQLHADGTQTHIKSYLPVVHFAEDAPYPRCIAVANYDVVRDQEARREYCVPDESGIHRISRATRANSDRDLCTSRPYDEGEGPGGCGVAASRGPESLWPLLLFGALGRRRRHAAK